MTREQALSRIEKLLRLAAQGSGATEEEARTAAVQAARLMAEHGIAPTSASPGACTSTIDTLEVLVLKLQLDELRRLIADRHRAHFEEIARRDEMWERIYDGVRRADDKEAKKLTKKAKVTAARKERQDLARSGGRARARKLTAERKKEIACGAAQARWAQWRSEHG